MSWARCTTGKMPRTWLCGSSASTKVVSLDEAPTPQVYFDPRQSTLTRTNLLFGTVGAPGAILPMVRQRIAQVDPRISILTARTMESYLSGTLERRRFVARLLVVVGVFALALAAFGIYAVVSYNVLHRASEVGIRMALGAGRFTVVRLFLRETATVVGLGGLAGAGIAIPVAYLIARSFTGTQAVLGPVLVASLVTLGLAALLATGVPAYRAAHCDPAQSLRME